MKKRFAFVALIGFAILVTIAVHAGENDAKKTKTILQGTWKSVKSNQGDVEAKFTGNKFVVSFEADRVYEGTFKLNAKEEPKQIDMKITDTPKEEYKNKTALGIFEIKGEKLTWCSNKPGGKRRPPRFAEQIGDAKLLLVTFERKK